MFQNAILAARITWNSEQLGVLKQSLEKSAFGLSRERTPARRPRPTVRLELEGLTERILPSVSPSAPPAVAEVSPQMSASLARWLQQMASVEQDLNNTWNLIAREVSYAQQQWQHWLGIPTSTQNQSLGVAVSPVGSGTITIQSASTSLSVSTAKPQVSNGPNFVGFDGYLWDPVNGTNASDGHNWDYKGQSQKNAADPLKPGDTPDAVLFDPKTTQQPGLNSNGASAITWDYTPARVISIQLGGQSAYTSLQTINSGITVDASVSANNTASNLNLDFNDVSSTFQIDGNSTITNMTLAGVSRNANFIINSGTTTVAQSPGYAETIGVQVTIRAGATLDDKSYNSLQFTNNNLSILVQGTMNTYAGGTSTLIDSGAYSGDYVDVLDGTLNYNGNGTGTNTFNAPVSVFGGTFSVLGGGGSQLTVKGTVPGLTPNASVYVRDSSTVKLTAGASLLCSNNYYQSGGTLETTDSSQCTLQAGTATIDTNATLWVDTTANDYGRLNVIGNLTLNGELDVSVQGYAPTGNAGTSDLLYVSQTLTLNNASSTIKVNDYGTLQKVGDLTDFWVVIESANNIGGDFASGSASPAANLTYGPSNAPTPKEYRVTFNG